VARALLLLLVLERTYRTVGSPTLLPVVNPWLDEDWVLETPRPTAGGGVEARRARPETLGFPKYSQRWPGTHLALLVAWVQPDLGLSWGRGLSHSGPINGHRRPLPPGPSRFLAARHRSWAVDEPWAPDRRRDTLALSDPGWLSTLKFWGWEPLPTPPLGHEYTVFRLQALGAHVVDLMGRTGPPSTPRGTLLYPHGLKGRRYFGLSWAPARPWFRRRWFRLQLSPIPREFMIPALRVDLRWYPQWTIPFLWRQQDVQHVYKPNWQLPELRFYDSWGKEQRKVPLGTTLVARTLNFWSGLIHTPPTVLGWRAVTGNLSALAEYWRCHPGAILKSAGLGAGFRLRWVWGWGGWRLFRYGGLYQDRLGWSHNVDAPDRPPIAQGGFLRSAWTPLRLRRLWALASLALGPEPAATATLRALGRFTCGSAGAALFGLATPHATPPAPWTTPGEPIPAVPLRLVRVVWAGVWGGRPPHPVGTPNPPSSASAHLGSLAPDPGGAAGPTIPLTPLKDAGPGAWDWAVDPYEGASYAFRMDYFYRTYSKERERMTAAARPSPSWGAEVTAPAQAHRPPAPLRAVIRAETGLFGHSPRTSPAPLDEAGRPELYAYPTAYPLGPYPVYPDMAFTYGPERAVRGGEALQPNLSFRETTFVPVPHYDYRYLFRHRWDRSTFRWGASGRTHNAGYPIYTKEVCGAPCWELAPWKCRPFFAEVGPYSLGHTWFGAGQLDTQGEVGGLPHYADGVPMRLMPPTGARLSLGSVEERTRWEPEFSYPHPHRGWRGSVDPAFQDRLDLMERDILDELLLHRGLGLNPEVTTDTKGRFNKIGEVGYLQWLIEGQTFERSGPLAYTRPPRPALPTTALWSRRGRALRGPGPWRFEWPDYAGPSRFTRHRYTAGLWWGPHVSLEGLNRRAGPRDIPGPNTYARVLPPRPDPTWFVGKKWRLLWEVPEALVEPRTSTYDHPPHTPRVLLRNYVGRLTPPQKDWALGPIPPRRDAPDQSWF
jgi:hypothetical protein